MACPRNQYANDYKFIFHLGPLTLMLSPLDDAADLFGHLKIIRNSNRRLLNLVNNLLQV